MASIAAAAVVVMAGPAQAGGPYMNRDWAVQLQPNTTAGSGWVARRNEPVGMICWTGGPYANGTGKWFHVTKSSYPYRDGFVPATAVSAQRPDAPYCR